MCVCVCLFSFTFIQTSIKPTTAYDAQLRNYNHYIFLHFAPPHGTPIVSKNLTNKCLLEENKKLRLKSRHRKTATCLVNLEDPLTTPPKWRCRCLVARAVQRCKESCHVTKMTMTCQKSNKPRTRSQKAHAETQLGTKGP
jgi:hypothetical protein